MTTSPESGLQVGLGDRYRIIRSIGRGGTADVYLAIDERHRRQVALKALLPEAVAAAGAARFLREIRIAARLTHPHILPLLDSGEAAGRPYYVMPFVAGESLQERIDPQAPLEVGEAIRLTCEVADALAYAHAAGVIHRDIKPGNVLLADRHALVTDFGAGRLLSPAADDLARTRLGMTLGTPLYMSPEQAAADDELDGRTDIYSLGCVLYEMLVGSPPFVGRNGAATIAMRLTQDPPPLRRRRPDLPAELEAAVLRALARDPDDRFRTASEFAASLSPLTFGPVRHGPSGVDATMPTLAVLQLADPAAHVGNDHLAAGITEELIDALSRLRNLRVIAATPQHEADMARGDPRVIGQHLGADSVLTGSVRRDAERVRISVRLLSAKDGSTLWAEQYRRHAWDDVFAIQEEVARSVAGALQVRLLGQARGTLVEVPTQSAAAHEHYLRGRLAWSKRTEDQLLRSVEQFEAAIALDPAYAQAHAGLAEALLLLGVYGVRAPAEVMPAAEAAARRALAGDPTMAVAHAVVGSVRALYHWDWHNAAHAFERSITLSPRHPTPHHWYAAHVLTPLGRFDEAVARARRALALDPLSAAAGASVGAILYAARRFEESVQEQQRVLEAEPHFALAHYFLGQALVQCGRHADAIAACHRAVAYSGDSVEATAALAHAYAAAGARRSALGLLDELSALAKRRYVSPYHFAHVHLGLGDHQAALRWLEQAVAVRATELGWIAVRPIALQLASEPRFAKILRDVGLSDVAGAGVT